MSNAERSSNIVLSCWLIWSFRQDTFKFTTNVPKTYNPKDSIEFCICFQAGIHSHWDNNDGENFKMICINPDLLSPEESDPNANFLPESIASTPSSVFY